MKKALLLVPVQEIEHDLEIRSERSALPKWEDGIIEVESVTVLTNRNRFDFAGDYVEEL